MVQLGEEPTHHVPAGSNLDRYLPSDQTLPLIGKLNNGHDFLSDIEESGEYKHHNKQEQQQEQDPLVSEKNKITFLIFYLCLCFFVFI
jgi:hypothetical protein